MGTALNAKRTDGITQNADSAILIRFIIYFLVG